MEFAEPFLTLYGPLGFGWVAAAILWRRLVKVQDATQEIVKSNIVALTTLKTLIENRTT